MLRAKWFLEPDLKDQVIKRTYKYMQATLE